MVDLAALSTEDAQSLWEELEIQECEGSLAAFVKAFWHVVEPSTPLVWGWPLDAMCLHLEKVSSGEITKLCMNVCPGFMKSLLTNVFFPAWEWGPRKMPHLRYVSASYNNKLTIRDNGRFRRVITSEKYKKYWGKVFGESVDQFNIIHIENNKTGWKLATSVGGMGTGARGDRFIIDDANNAFESESEAVLESTSIWMREVVPDRLNNMEKSAIINIQQRTNEGDATGTLLSLNIGYVHVMIPMRFDADRRCKTPFWTDPRKKDGELAWATRFPKKIVDDLEKTKGPYAWASQYQQLPSPRGGGIILRDWWQPWYNPKNRDDPFFRSFPKMEYIVASLDPAFTNKDVNDYSALTIWGVWRDQKTWMPRIMLLNAWQARLHISELVEKVRKSCSTPYYVVDKLLIEDKASGHSVHQEIRRLFGVSSWSSQLVTPRGDKMGRLYAIQHLFSEHMIYSPHPDIEWVKLVIDNLANFPAAKHDDIVDSASQALLFLRNSGWALRTEEQQDIYNRKFAPGADMVEAIYDI